MSTREPPQPGTGRGASGLAAAALPAPGAPWTPILLTRWSGEYLRAKGVEGGRLDAELLLAQVLGLKRLDLYLQHDRPLHPSELETFKALLKRRAGREPLQYILGRVSFRELELRADARALIPRPETEVLVGEVLDWVRERAGGQENGEAGAPGAPDWDGPLRALDLGTGTGAIALSLLREGPFREVVATDPSPDALALARQNARELGLEHGLELRPGSLFEPVGPGERFHAVVSNPPYIAEGDRQGLPPEIRDWEPPQALFAGPLGLDVLQELARQGPGVLVRGGLLALEVGLGQASALARIMEDTGRYAAIRVRPDLSGRPRFVLGVASGPQKADL